MFAKIFDTEEVGQVVVMKSESDECEPMLAIYMKPPDMGVCMVGPKWDDDDDGWAKLDKAFEEFATDDAVKAANGLLKTLRKLTEHSEQDSQ